jgi:hypothetical protein
VVFDKKINKTWALVIVYGASHEVGKEEFLVELAQVCSNQTFPISVGGNFNLLRFSLEKNKDLKNNRNNDILNQVINLYELRELVMIGGLLTWSNNQKNPTLEKLDRLLVTKEWETLFPLALVHKILRNRSDNNPLILKLNNEHVKQSKDFRYELY